MRFTPATILSEYAAIADLNGNFSALANLLERLLLRDGTEANSMSRNLDMNHFNVQNLAAPVDPNDAARLTDVQALVAANGNELETLATDSGAGLIGSSDGQTVQSHIGTIETNVSNIQSSLGTKDLGVLGSGTNQPLLLSKSATGNPAGTSDWRSIIFGMTYNGVYGTTAQINTSNFQANFDHTAGNITFAYCVQAYNSLGGAGTTGVTTGTITTSRVFEAHTANKSSNASAIDNATNFYSGDVDLDRSGSTGTIGTLRGFYCGDQGHATRVTVAAVGYDCNDMTAGAPLTAAFRHNFGSGTGKWGFYGNGSANNAFGGNTKFGAVTVPAEVLDAHGNCTVDGVYKVGGTQVVGARQTGVAGNASDLATAITLVNDLRAKLIAHGLIA